MRNIQNKSDYFTLLDEAVNAMEEEIVEESTFISAYNKQLYKKLMASPIDAFKEGQRYVIKKKFKNFRKSLFSVRIKPNHLRIALFNKELINIGGLK